MIILWMAVVAAIIYLLHFTCGQFAPRSKYLPMTNHILNLQEELTQAGYGFQGVGDYSEYTFGIVTGKTSYDVYEGGYRQRVGAGDTLMVHTCSVGFPDRYLPERNLESSQAGALIGTPGYISIRHSGIVKQYLDAIYTDCHRSRAARLAVAVKDKVFG